MWCDKCQEEHSEDDGIEIAPVCIDRDDYDKEATVTMAKGRFYYLFSAMIYAINRSDMPIHQRVEWAVVLKGLAAQAGILCEHGSGFHTEENTENLDF